MLIRIKTLTVENNGYRRETFSRDIYINSDNIISIMDHPAIDDFLLTENLKHSGEKFCIVKLSHGNKSEDVIAFGTSAMIYSQISEQTKGKSLLNG